MQAKYKNKSRNGLRNGHEYIIQISKPTGHYYVYDEDGYIDDYYDKWIDRDITLGYFANKQAINKWIDEHENENEEILNEDKYVCYDLDLRMEEIEVIE